MRYKTSKNKTVFLIFKNGKLIPKMKEHFKTIEEKTGGKFDDFISASWIKF